MLKSDAAAYMCRAGKVLKEIYPNLLHVTCSKSKKFYNEVDNLIATVKTSVAKNISRAIDFDVCGIPQQPIANYYAEKLPQMR